MLSFRVLAPLVVVAALVGLVAFAPGSAQPASESQPPASYAGPIAHAAGGDVVALTYPSLVNVRVMRAEAALEQATLFADRGSLPAATQALSAARVNMQKAWAAAKYVIANTPPPVEEDVARASGDPAGPALASIYDTGFAALNLQHTVVTTSLGLVDTTNAALLAGVRSAVTAARQGRDAAITYIHSIDVVPPEEDAQASQDDVAGWSTVMPNVIPQLDDELQQVAGTEALNPRLSAAGRQILSSAELGAIKTQRNVNRFWPPVPPED